MRRGISIAIGTSLAALVLGPLPSLAHSPTDGSKSWASGASSAYKWSSEVPECRLDGDDATEQQGSWDPAEGGVVIPQDRGACDCVML